MSTSQDFDKKVELGLRLNSKLQEFTKGLSREEQKGIGTLMRLAEIAVHESGIALFGLENREIVRKVRRKLIEPNCEDADLSATTTTVTTPTTTVTMMDSDILS